MRNKKIIYVLVLIIMIVIIGILIANLNTKSVEKTNENKLNVGATNNSYTKTTKGETKEVTADMNQILDIKEKMFIQQTNDIYMNVKEYEGKTISLQGLMHTFIDSNSNNETIHYVMRRTPGCCGNDGSAGLEVVWDKEYPKDDEWVEAIGVIKSIDKGGYYGIVPVLYLTSLEVKQERGAEFVTQ